MLFKKKKNPNSDFLATAAPISQPQPAVQPAPQPAPQQSAQSTSEDNLTIDKLLMSVDHVEDPVVKSKFYLLMSQYYYKGTHGAPKDEDKALEYLKLSVDTDNKNADAHYQYGALCYIKGSRDKDSKLMAKGLTHLIFAHNGGSKAAYETLGTIAKSNIFPNVSTADELIAYLLKK